MPWSPILYGFTHSKLRAWLSPALSQPQELDSGAQSMGRRADFRAVRPPPPCRQLSEDLLATRQALEKETRLRQDLQQEKEELVFRVLGAQADPSFPLARTTPTPTQVPFLAT